MDDKVRYPIYVVYDPQIEAYYWSVVEDLGSWGNISRASGYANTEDQAVKDARRKKAQYDLAADYGRKRFDV